MINFYKTSIALLAIFLLTTANSEVTVDHEQVPEIANLQLAPEEQISELLFEKNLEVPSDNIETLSVLPDEIESKRIQSAKFKIQLEQPENSKKPEIGKPEVAKKRTTNSIVKIITNDMGVKIYHMEDNSSPIIHLALSFKNSGSAYQEKNKAGIPKLYSATTFCGCGSYSQSQFEQNISNISSEILCISNMDCISFFLTAPTIVLEDAVSLLQTAIYQPQFEKEKFLLIQNSLVAGIQNYAINPVMSATEIFLPSIIFKSHPYENGVYGSSEDIAKLTIADLLKYKEEHLIINNAEACIFGDVSEEKAKSIVSKLLKNLKKEKKTCKHVPEVVPDISNTIKHYYAEGPQSTIVLAMKNKRVKSPNRYAAKILSRILGERHLFRGRIIEVLRTKLGLIYSGAVMNVDFKHSGYLLGILSTDNSKVEQAISAIREIIKDMKENGITQEELDFAKKNISGSLLVELRTSNDMLKFFYTAMKLDLAATALSDLLDGIENVSLSDVKEVSKKIFDENNIAIVVIGGNNK